MLPWDRNPGTESPGVPLWDLVVAANKYDLLPVGQKGLVEVRWLLWSSALALRAARVFAEP